MIYLLTVLLVLSVAINVVLVWYCRKVLLTVFNAAEGASAIFTRLDTYREHLKSIYELELFYGDRNLKEVIEHTKDLIEFLKKYDEVYSFTQPELEEILKEEDITQDGDEPKEVEKIFHKRS